LLTVDDPARWPIPDRDLARRCIGGLEELAARFGRESIIDLCFAYARAHAWLAGIVVGAETAAQLAENVRLFRKSTLTPEQEREAADVLPQPLPEQLLNPALWSNN
jgi:aryl-alcohol dehydrogenase-like predicted oxidoreductase